MQGRSVVERLQILEQREEILEMLPARVANLELEIRQLRDEMHVAFSATREDLRAEIRAGDEETRREMRALNEETRRHMLVLHEQVISTIATINEDRPRRKRP